MDGKFDIGLEQRKATLGAEYVEKNLAAADELTRPFQEAMTAWCWGFGWGDDTIDAKTRSMMNLAMIGALGKMPSGKSIAAAPLTMVFQWKKFAPSSMWSAFIAVFRSRWNASALRESIDRRGHASGRITAVCLCEDPYENCPYFCLSTRFTTEQTLLPEWWAVAL